MPAGLLRSALVDFAPSISSGGVLAHGPGRPPSSDFLALESGGLVPHGLGRKARAASFLDIEWEHRPRASRTAFSKSTDPVINLEQQEVEDQEVMSKMERKVDDRLLHLRQDTEKKVDEFFKTMREAYGVPYGSAPRGVGGGGGGGGVGSGSGPKGTDDGSSWEGPKVRIKIPDLPPGKHAIVTLEREPDVAVGGMKADTQQQALSNLLTRLEGSLKKVTGQPAEEARETGSGQLAGKPPPGSMSELYQEVQMIKGNLGGTYSGADALPTSEQQLQKGDLDNSQQIAKGLEALQKQPMPAMKPHCYQVPWPSKQTGPGEQPPTTEDARTMQI